MILLRNWLASIFTALVVVLNPVPSPTPVPTDLTHQSEIKIVEKEGYSVIGLENDKLSNFDVLIGIATGSADGYDKRAFFFYDGSYLGADSSSPHPQISLAWRDDKTIALNYFLYNKNDPMCCPTGGSKIVRFQWDGTKLAILDTIPAPETSESIAVPGSVATPKQSGCKLNKDAITSFRLEAEAAGMPMSMIEALIEKKGCSTTSGNSGVVRSGFDSSKQRELENKAQEAEACQQELARYAECNKQYTQEWEDYNKCITGDQYGKSCFKPFRICTKPICAIGL